MENARMKPIMVSGVIRGNTVEFNEPAGFPDGQHVRVTIIPIKPGEKSGDGIRRCSGGMAPYWTEEDDRILEQIQLGRKAPSNRPIPEWLTDGRLE